MVLLSGFVYRADCTLKAENPMRSDGTSVQILNYVFKGQKIRAMKLRISMLENHILHKNNFLNEIILLVSIPTLSQ